MGALCSALIASITPCCSIMSEHTDAPLALPGQPARRLSSVGGIRADVALWSVDGGETHIEMGLHLGTLI